jgi:hypothetical protein
MPIFTLDPIATGTGFDDRGVFSDLGVCINYTAPVFEEGEETPSPTKRPRFVDNPVDRDPASYTCEGRCGGTVRPTS